VCGIYVSVFQENNVMIFRRNERIATRENKYLKWNRVYVLENRGLQDKYLEKFYFTIQQILNIYMYMYRLVNYLFHGYLTTA